MRHSVLVTENDPEKGTSITTHARAYPSNFCIELHAHGSDQLIYASRGVMEISSGKGLWILPPHFGLWVPAHTAHSVRMLEYLAMRTLYLRRGMHKSWTSCNVFHVVPFLRELIFEIVHMGGFEAKTGWRSRIETYFFRNWHRQALCQLALRFRETHARS